MILNLLLACGVEEKAITPTEGEVIIEDVDGDGYTGSEDCNDEDASIFPDQVEICDGLDNNCDGQVDEEVLNEYFADSDQDGFGNPNLTVFACEPDNGFVATGTDCDDSDNEVYPGSEEICDNKDNDCDSDVDEGLGSTFFLDADYDGFGDASTEVLSCQLEVGMSTIDGDCDDTNAQISPVAEEICDGIDNNCNEEIDDGVLITFYADFDEDGFGDASSSVQSCTILSGYVDNDDDCDDLESFSFPTAFEICDGIDNNCNNLIDESGASGEQTFFMDYDQDGFGDPDSTITSCTQPSDYVMNSDDCNDGLASISPDAVETCNAIDDNCNELVDDEPEEGILYFADYDNDGFGTPLVTQVACSTPLNFIENDDDCDDQDNDNNPNASEICDEVDNDCDGDVDEDDAIDAPMWYHDLDIDGQGDPTSGVTSCLAPENMISDSQDCDDDNENIFVGADEVCDGIDNNCDEAVDGTTSVDAMLIFEDLDGDGDGNIHQFRLACNVEDGFVAVASDCNDEEELQSGLFDETCNGLDSNCDGTVDNNPLDMDCDGIAPSLDCDDSNEALLSKEDDFDCDGVLNTEDNDADNDLVPAVDDCDDFDPESTTKANDFDCDGVTNDLDTDADNDLIQAIDDCDDFDPTSNSKPDDLDCDGLLNSEDDNADGDDALAVDDCDDFDPNSTTKANDFDCDGFLVDEDCDDSNVDLNTELSGLSSDCAADNCQDIRNLGYTSGGYWLKSDNGDAINVYCEMDVDDMAWIDIIASFYIPDVNIAAQSDLFFQVTSSSYTLDITPATGSSSSLDGIYITIDGPSTHSHGIHLFFEDVPYTHVKANYYMQGSNDNNRCATGNWIPLSGPGYDGGFTAGYLASCVSGYSCIQGSSTNGRDAPIAVAYENSNFDSSSQLLTWSFSDYGASATGCARSSEIPTGEPSTFFNQLLIR